MLNLNLPISAGAGPAAAGDERQDRAEAFRVREIENLRAENEHLRGRLKLLSELGARVASSLELESVLQSVVDAACELTGAQYGALVVFDESNRIQQLVAHGIPEEQRRLIGGLPRGLGLLGWLQTLQQPVRLADLTRHPRSIGFPPNHPPMRTFLGMPVRRLDEPLGNLYLTEKAGGEEFTPEDESLLLLFASQAASAINNARLHGRLETQRQAAEAERRRLETVINSSPDGIIYVDARTREAFANTRASEILGPPADYSDNRALYEGAVRASDGTALPRESLPLSRALSGAFVAGEEHLVVSPGHGDVPVLCSAAPVRDADGRISGAVVQFQDVTAIKLAQGRIAELAAERGRLLELNETERKRLEALVEASPVGVLVADAASRQIVLANREAARIMGSGGTPGESLDKYLMTVRRERPDGKAYGADELPIARALSRGESVHAEEIHFKYPDGSAIPTLVSATPLRSGDGSISGAVAIMQDISPFLEAEKLRSEFLGIVSHELKTPLTAIKGAASVFLGSKSGFSESETKELFQIIDQESDRLRDLVDDLLDISRIEAGALTVTPEPTDLKEILTGAIATFRTGHSGQQIALHMSPNLPPVKADRRRIDQVVGNLLDNAGKFSPRGGPIVIDFDHDSTYVTVSVRDEGIGIPADKIPHLFRKFTQVHEGAVRDVKGSGLGLAIARGIIEAHGGRIWAQSPGAGLGSTFSFSLPLAATPAQTASAVPSHRTENLSNVIRRNRPRVLAVDDDANVLRFLRRSLSEAGYNPTVTGDPRELTRLMEIEQPDLVLLDLMLPGTSGFELLSRIREFSGVPVIFLTASGRDEDAVRALKSGADDYITKPFSPSEVLARIEATLRRHVLADQMEVRPPFVSRGLTVDFGTRRVTVNGKDVRLTATEYKLLYELASNAGRVLTHDRLLKRVWGPEYSGELGLVRAMVRSLRRKLGDNAHKPVYIESEPRVGYRMLQP